MHTPTFWKKCSTCKKEIPFSENYYLCNVSTCRHKRKGYRFCSVSCWDEHLAFANHRESWAEEERSPSKEAYLNELAAEGGNPTNKKTEERAPQRKIIDSKPSIGIQAPRVTNSKVDTLVVVSKVKNFIKDRSGMNVSQCCIDALTKKVVQESLKAIEEAKKVGRKTVMGRDII